MGPHLTYRPREGIVVGTVAGRAIRLATVHNQAAANVQAWQRAAGPVATDIYDWRKVQEVRTGGLPAGPFAHRLTVAENAALEIYDYPGDYAQRFDGINPGGAAGGSTNHRQHSRVVWIKSSLKASFPAGGLCLHGPPPCGNPWCIVIAQDWDSLFHALKAARHASLAVEL